MGFFAKLLGITPKKQPLHIDDDNFQREVLQSKEPVILDVWGPNCQPCKKLEPIIMQLAAEYDGRVKVCELNSQDAPRTAMRLKVKGTPTVLYFKGGREKERVVGMRGSLFHEQSIEELFGIPKEAE
ncbi:MAG TPA: thiol reductase thioredoxin [Myxococcales bacterium]|nr:thiol reductase thioredoxin [Myxococcales bacterium]|tara:strand:+ start:84 stop:464 length:381 start_codon:yes stop_codon:yes gene_type:complete